MAATGNQRRPRGGAGESDRNNAGPVLVAGPGHNPSSSAVEEADDLFRRYRDNLRPREGGFADRPTDRGGPTNEGISQRTVDDLRERPEWRYLPERSADLSDEKIDEIYRKEYFDRPQIDKLQRVPGLSDSAPQLPEQIFDAGILHGTDAAGRWLQEALDEVTGSDLRVRNSNKSSHYDGIIGSRTREALRRAVKRGQARNINNRVVEKRRSHMEDLVHRAPDQRENLRGWLGRAEMFRIR